MTLVQDGLQNTRISSPSKTALVCGGRRLSYAEIDDMSNRLANALVAGGVQRGDRVGIYLFNSVEAVVGIYAVLKAGATFVCINRSTKLEKLSFIVGDCGATALITDRTAVAHGLTAELRQRNDSLKMVVTTGKEDLCDGSSTLGYDFVQSGFPASRPRVGTIDLDLACLIYTSGSTGEPKGVMSDHSNVVFAAQSIISYLENTPDDVVLNVLPLSFDYGLYQLLMAFTFGGTLVLEATFAYPVTILQRIQEERVTGFPGVPTVFASLLQMDLSRYDLSSLRYISNTAAALPPSHILELRGKFPAAKLFSMYGLTETKRTLYLPPEELELRPGSVGIPIPGTEAWIEGPDGSRLGPNEVGELVVRGRHVMRGYWQAPEATALRYRPGPIPGERLCYTGDLFRTDDQGFFYFVGRQDEIIKSRGEKVPPKEVEAVLYGLPGVREAIVIGVPDPVLGQAIKAFIVSQNPQLTVPAVLAHCRARLEDFMVPKYVEFRDDLPKGSSGKLLRRALASPEYAQTASL